MPFPTRRTGEVTLETSFKDDLKGASVQMVALVSEIENELDAMVTLQDAAACETIGDLVDMVEEERIMSPERTFRS